MRQTLGSLITLAAPHSHNRQNLFLRCTQKVTTAVMKNTTGDLPPELQLLSLWQYREGRSTQTIPLKSRQHMTNETTEAVRSAIEDQATYL